MASVRLEQALESLFDVWSQTDLIYGQTDCAMSVFRFIADAYGDDRLLTRWQGRYAGRLHAARMVKAKGGPERFANRQLQSIGFVKTIETQNGDIGLVRDTTGQAIMAVRIGPERWASKAAFGVFIHKTEAEIAWTRE